MAKKKEDKKQHKNEDSFIRKVINFFKDEDHVTLSRAIQRRKNLNWIITYDSHSFIHNLYEETQTLSYVLPYSAGSTKTGTESLFCKDSLSLPTLVL